MGLLSRIWLSDYLQEQKLLKCIWITKTHSSMGDSLKNPRNWSILHSLQSVQQGKSVLSKWLSWSKPLPDSSAGFCFFQAPRLVSESSLQLCLFDIRLSIVFVYIVLGREGPRGSTQFQGLPITILNCIPSVFRNFPGRWNVSILEETAIHQWF